MRVVVIVVHLAEVFARNAEIVGQVVITGGDDELAGAKDIRTAEAIPDVNRERAIRALHPRHMPVLPDVEFVKACYLTVVLESFVPGRLGIGTGKRDVADFEQLRSGEEGHMRWVMKQGIADATFVDRDHPQTGAPGLDGTRQAG